jgi:hypothetical protein
VYGGEITHRDQLELADLHDWSPWRRVSCVGGCP